MYKDEKYDFRALGQAIKEARESRGITREQLGGACQSGTPLHHVHREQRAAHPSLQVFYVLASYFHISVDQYFYSDDKPERSSLRKRVDSLLDGLDETELIIMEATARGIREAKEARKE